MKRSEDPWSLRVEGDAFYAVTFRLKLEVFTKGRGFELGRVRECEGMARFRGTGRGKVRREGCAEDVADLS